MLVRNYYVAFGFILASCQLLLGHNARLSPLSDRHATQGKA